MASDDMRPPPYRRGAELPAKTRRVSGSGLDEGCGAMDRLAAQQRQQHFRIAEADGSTGATLREYIWLEDMPAMVVDNVNTATPTTLFVHTDHLLRPIRLTDGARATVWQATWSPFGTAHAITGTAHSEPALPRPVLPHRSRASPTTGTASTTPPPAATPSPIP